MKFLQVAILVILTATPCLAQKRGTRTNPDLSRSNSLKIQESKHFVVYFTGGFMQDVPFLIRNGEAFIERLQKRWAVIFPEEKIRVSIGREKLGFDYRPHFEAPRWLQSRYDANHRRIDLRVIGRNDFDRDRLAAALRHEIVHYLLNRHNLDRLPPMLEEGIAQHEVNAGVRDDYLVIWGLYGRENLRTYLEDPNNFQESSDFYYAAALSERYVAWLWRHNPGGKTEFMQRFLKGERTPRALRSAKFTPVKEHFPAFEQSLRRQYPVYRILLTIDFWLIFFGLAVLVFALVKVILAINTARLIHEVSDEMEADVEEIVDETAFTGPAFGQEPLPAGGPISTPSARRSPAKGRRTQAPAQQRKASPVKKDPPTNPSLPKLPTIAKDSGNASKPNQPSQIGKEAFPSAHPAVEAPSSLPSLPGAQENKETGALPDNLAEGLDEVFDNLVIDSGQMSHQRSDASERVKPPVRPPRVRPPRVHLPPTHATKHPPPEPPEGEMDDTERQLDEIFSGFKEHRKPREP